MKSTVNNKKYQLTTSTGKRDEETQKEINVKIRKLQKVINAMLLYNQSFKQEDRNFSRNFRHGGCRHYASDAKRKRFAVTSLWKDYLDVKYYDVTMIMQLTVDRIKLLNLHVENWSGPMSVTLYVKVDELRELEESLTTTTSVLHRDNVDIHLVVKTGVTILQFILENVCGDKSPFFGASGALCFRLQLTPPMGFKARVDALSPALDVACA